jgi:hypothetical protein
MPNEQSSLEEKLQKLGERLRLVAAKLRPVSEQDIEKVRAAVEPTPDVEKEIGHLLDRDETPDPDQDQDQDQDQDHDKDRGR